MMKDECKCMGKWYMLCIAVVLGLIAAVVVLAIAMNEQPDIKVSTSPDQQRDIIMASAEGKITLEPDEAELYIDIETEATDAKECQQQNAIILARVMQNLKAKGVSEKDIETVGYSMYPKTNWNSDTGKSSIYGYRLSHTLKVTTKNIKETGELIDAAVLGGANAVNTVNFKLSDSAREKAYNDALELASAKAKAKAQAMASAAGARLGKIVSISESGGYYPMPMFAGMAEKAMDSTVGADTTISPTEVDVTTTVTISYEIE